MKVSNPPLFVDSLRQKLVSFFGFGRLKSHFSHPKTAIFSDHCTMYMYDVYYLPSVQVLPFWISKGIGQPVNIHNRLLFVQISLGVLSTANIIVGFNLMVSLLVLLARKDKLYFSDKVELSCWAMLLSLMSASGGGRKIKHSHKVERITARKVN